MKQKRILVTLDKKTLDQLQEVATSNSLTKSNVIRLFIKAFLSEDSKSNLLTQPIATN